jgi:OOP family OmpA-OmpF porin
MFATRDACAPVRLAARLRALAVIAVLSAGAAMPARAQTATVIDGQAQEAQASRQVVVTGKVPDEATRAVILARLRQLYGADAVVDQIQVTQVVAPPNWSAHVEQLIAPNLKQVQRGQLSVQGNNVEFKGEVGSEAIRQQVASVAAQSLNATYVVRNSLRVAAREQDTIDAVLANRIVEFEPGSSTLTPSGMAIIDELARALAGLGGRKVEVIGHTDAIGARDMNIALSRARADAVKAQLERRGIAPDRVTTSGEGPDRPVASNTSAEGRARNRRIEFRVSE